MASGLTGDGVAVGVADALPIEHGAPRERLGEGDGALLVGGVLGQCLDGRDRLRVATISAVVSGRDLHAHAGGEVVPARARRSGSSVSMISTPRCR